MNLNIPNFGERNSFRLPDYHRLDINLTLKPRKITEKLKAHGSLVFIIFITEIMLIQLFLEETMKR